MRKRKKQQQKESQLKGKFKLENTFLRKMYQLLHKAFTKLRRTLFSIHNSIKSVN